MKNDVSARSDSSEVAHILADTHGYMDSARASQQESARQYIVEELTLALSSSREVRSDRVYKVFLVLLLLGATIGLIGSILGIIAR